MEHKENIDQYKKRINNALSNNFLRSAMDNFAVAYRTGRKNAFSGMDINSLIKEVSFIKQNALENMEMLLQRFSSRAEQNGVHVHLAETAEDACSIIEKIAEDTSSKKIIKSKSMTAEEIHLNTWLESHGLEVTETDLGEWIVQLRHEGPSHMVMPAIHLSRFQVADLFSDVTGRNEDSEIEKLVKVARKKLRNKFIEADMGITGANFVLADSGTIGIVTNEGNARLVTTLPRVHVVLAGIDKLLPSIKEALTINKVLPRNATGQAITSYVTWITGPSQCSITENKKREMHIVFLDNGRKKIADQGIIKKTMTGKKIAWHSPCHLCRGLGIKDDPKELIKKSGSIYVRCDEEETCCGFGGLFSVEMPEISGALMTTKIDHVEATGAETLVGYDMSCLMHLAGGMRRRGTRVDVRHIAEILADGDAT